MLNNRLQNIKDEVTEVKALIKHFLVRYVTNDSLTYDDQRTEYLVFISAFTGGMGWYIADNNPKLFFMTVMMTLTAIYCVAVWDRLLMDHKDYQNLTVLPIKNRTLYLSKFLSSLLVIALISFAFSFLSTLQYADAYSTSQKVNGYYFWFTLFIVDFIANWFVFLAVAAIQSLLMILFRGNLFNRISLLIQLLLLMGISSTFVWFPRVFEGSPDMGRVFSSIHYILPSLWFDGLHQWVNGIDQAIHQFHVIISLSTLAGLQLCYLITLAFSLKRHSKQVSQRPAGFSFRKTKLFLKGRKIFNAVLLRNPVERARYDFFLKQLKRSREQKIRLALLTCLPVGFVITQMVFLYSKIGTSGFGLVNPALVSFPFVLYFPLLVGLRSVVRMPITLEANWIFKLSPRQNAKYFVSGFKKAVYFHIILPVSCAFFLFYFISWGLVPALTHTVYCITFALMMLEVFFVNYRQVPFTALSDPMSLNFKLIWPFLVLLFIVYYYIFTTVGVWLLMDSSANIIYYSLLILILFAFKWNSNKVNGEGLIFEDKPVFVMLNLEDYQTRS